MKKSEIAVIAKVLEQVATIENASVKFRYAVARNIKIVAPIVTPIFEMRDKVEQEFETKRLEACNEFASKGEDGEPLTEGDKFVGLDGNKDFEARMVEISKEFESKFAEYRELLDTDEEVDMYSINLDTIPEGVDTIALIALEPLIKE